METLLLHLTNKLHFNFYVTSCYSTFMLPLFIDGESYFHRFLTDVRAVHFPKSVYLCSYISAIRGHFKLEESEQSEEKLMERARRFGSDLGNKPKTRLSLTTTSLASVVAQDVSYFTGFCRSMYVQTCKAFSISGTSDHL